MDYIIQLVGIMLIVASTTPGAPYRVLVPEWNANDRFCPAQQALLEHRVYLRVDTASINEQDTVWPANQREACQPGALGAGPGRCGGAVPQERHQRSAGRA